MFLIELKTQSFMEASLIPGGVGAKTVRESRSQIYFKAEAVRFLMICSDSNGVSKSMIDFPIMDFGN